MKRKLLNENFELVRTSIEEGVADKYAAEKFGIQDPEDEFEKQYQQKLASQTGQQVGDIKGKPVLKNPGSVKNFPPGARGVITKEGDLYMVADAENVIHQNILDTLKKKGIVKGEVRAWEDPNDLDKFGFLTVQRVWNTNSIAIGESMMIPKPKRAEERKAAFDLFKPYLKAAQQKNPQIKFINNQVRVVAKKVLTPDEYEKYKSYGS